MGLTQQFLVTERLWRFQGAERQARPESEGEEGGASRRSRTRRRGAVGRTFGCRGRRESDPTTGRRTQHGRCTRGRYEEEREAGRGWHIIPAEAAQAPGRIGCERERCGSIRLQCRRTRESEVCGGKGHAHVPAGQGAGGGVRVLDREEGLVLLPAPAARGGRGGDAGERDGVVVVGDGPAIRISDEDQRLQGMRAGGGE